MKQAINKRKPSPGVERGSFAGRWQTTFGPMNLTQEGRRIHGVYSYRGTDCSVAGKLEQGRFVFRYQEPSVGGDGWFELARRGKAFSGQYRPDGAADWESWEGERVSFDGLWNTSFGLMRLVEDGDGVRGFYEGGGSSTINGRLTGDRLVFSYKEPKARGRGKFTLSEDGLSFQGEWKPSPHRSPPPASGEGKGGGWRPWTGIRVRPRPNINWLVVLEAPWQRFLSDHEYAFGNMLREFFARVPNVQFRHRYFTNEPALRKCFRDLMYIAEPIVLVLATHAQRDGITVDGQTISIQPLLDDLEFVSNLRLLHFSACLLMQDSAMVGRLQEFAARARTSLSGYKTSVDWAASAIIEFMYFDLILSRGLSPAAAAEQMLKLLPFAGEEGVPEVALRPAGFTIVAPDGAERNGAPARKK